MEASVQVLWKFGGGGVTFFFSLLEESVNSYFIHLSAVLNLFGKSFSA